MIRFFALLCTCLCIFFYSSCTIISVHIDDENAGDKSLLCAETVCDDKLYIYFVRTREVLKIDKSTFTVSETGLPATHISIYDGALYRIHKGVLYKDDTVISLPSAPGYDQFVVGDFGCWVTGSAFNVAYMSSDIDDPNKWEETPKTFPIVDNSGNLHFAEIEERGEYFDHIIDGISVLKVQHGYFPYNDRFYIYDENVYYVYKRVLYVVSLKNGHISEKSYSVDRILSVGHDAIYFCIGDRIIKESISSKKMFECTLSLPSSESLSASDVCYIDSYHDTVYIFDCDDETVKCSIATFNELIS